MIELAFVICTMAGDCAEVQLETFDTMRRCEAVIPAASAFIMQYLAFNGPEGVYLEGSPECRLARGAT